MVATESYEQFAENLQHEIEQDTGIRFGIIEKHQFAAISVIGEDGKMEALGFDNSEKLWEQLQARCYIDTEAVSYTHLDVYKRQVGGLS